jgi:DNA replication licensing factor MCM5
MVSDELSQAVLSRSPQSGFDAPRIYSVGVLEGAQNPDAPSQLEDAFLAFLSGFRVGGEFIYRDRLRSSLLLHHHSLEVDLRDLGVWNEELGQKVQEQPGEMVPLVRASLPCTRRR